MAMAYEQINFKTSKALILVGATGAGKTCHGHLLAGNQLFAKKKKRGDWYLDDKDNTDQKIGHKLVSETTLPNHFVRKVDPSITPVNFETVNNSISNKDA